jgi:hypothetical protein
MLGKGEKECIPSAGASLNTDFKAVRRIQVPLGITYGFAMSERVNIFLTEGFYSAFITINEEGEEEDTDTRFLNYGGMETKIGLERDQSALSVVALYHIGPGEYELSLQIGIKYIRTFYFPSGVDFTLTPHFGYILSGYAGPFLGTHLSTGIPIGKKVTLRPEIGVSNIDFSEWMINTGVGFNISL